MRKIASLKDLTAEAFYQLEELCGNFSLATDAPVIIDRNHAGWVVRAGRGDERVIGYGATLRLAVAAAYAARGL